MKKALFIAAVAATLCSCGNKQKFVVNGDIAGLEGTVYLFERDSLIDSAVVTAGKFQFKGIAAEPGVRYILDSRDGEAQNLAQHFILEPGTITVKSDEAQKNHITGTPANDAAEAYTTAANALFEEFRNPATTDERRSAIETEYNDMTRKTVEANLNNFFGVALLPNIASELTGQETLDLIAKFQPELQQTKELTELKTSAGQKMKTEIGQPYIDIVQNNAEGQPVSLKSVIENPANKYTLVDFWASWCNPCMAEVPYLIKTYKEFHSKGFEIYGVSFDRDRESWLAAVKDKQMNWIQVSDLNNFDNQAAKDYSIRGIPSNFLIDAQGVIVAKNLRGEELYEKVAELLK